VPWAPDYQMLYEHLHRYYLAQRYCHGRRVLDLACGEGYGSAMIAEVADQVVAVDVDGPTISHARATYHRNNLKFVESSMLETRAFRDGPFDVVVCFEAIEHIEEHEELLSAIKGALTPAGITVVSTPDRVIYSEAVDYHNPFHIRELCRDEFRQLLQRHFKHVTLLSQQTVVGSRIDNLTDTKGDPEEVTYVELDGATWVERGKGPVPYLVAVASDLDEMVPESSSLIDVGMQALRVPSRQLEEARSELRAANDAAARELEAVRIDRSRLEAQHYAHDAQIGALEASIRDLVRQAREERDGAAHAYAVLDASRTELDAQLQNERLISRELSDAVEAMQTSRGWRIMESLRAIRAHRRTVAGAFRRRPVGGPPPPV
jgi:O-antigen biosynthesis protein